VTAPLALPVDWTDPTFLPYDWSWFAFVYDRTKIDTVPADFEALAASDLKILIEDPRSSTPGLGLLLWVKAAYGDRAAEIWKGLADNIVTVTPGWSEAYGMFLEGEADMVLSYTTSPAYHLIAEGDDSKAAAPFAEGHYLQVERGTGRPLPCLHDHRCLPERHSRDQLDVSRRHPVRGSSEGIRDTDPA
jgi:thiamine transport system substrate-binding protein